MMIDRSADGSRVSRHVTLTSQGDAVRSGSQSALRCSIVVMAACWTMTSLMT